MSFIFQRNELLALSRVPAIAPFFSFFYSLSINYSRLVFYVFFYFLISSSAFSIATVSLHTYTYTFQYINTFSLFALLVFMMPKLSFISFSWFCLFTFVSITVFYSVICKSEEEFIAKILERKLHDAVPWNVNAFWMKMTHTKSEEKNNEWREKWTRKKWSLQRNDLFRLTRNGIVQENASFFLVLFSVIIDQHLFFAPYFQMKGAIVIDTMIWTKIVVRKMQYKASYNFLSIENISTAQEKKTSAHRFSTGLIQALNVTICLALDINNLFFLQAKPFEFSTRTW